MTTQLRRVLLLAAFVLCAAIPALATDITIQSFTIPNYRYGGATCKLRLYSSDNWTDSAGIPHFAGTAGSTTGWYQEVACTVSGTTVTVPQFVTPSTTDSIDKPTVRITAVLFDSVNRARQTIFSAWRIPSSPTTFSWLELVGINAAKPAPLGDRYPTVEQVVTLIHNSSSGVPGSRTVTPVAPLTGGGPLSSDITIGCQTASGSQAGCLTSTDWTTFNNKLAGNQTITLSGDVSGSGATSIETTIGIGKVTNSMLAGGIANNKLANSTITINTGPGLSGGATVALGGSATLNNTGVLSITGTANQVIANQSTGAVTLSLPQSIATTSVVQFGGLGLGTGTPRRLADFLSTSTQLRLSYADNSVFADFTVGNGGDLTVAPTGGFRFDTANNQIDPVTGYDQNLGALNRKYLTLHVAELWSETLVAQNTLATIGGRILVGRTTPLIADVTTGATTIDVKYNNLNNGDRVYLEADNKVEFIAVASSPTTIAGGFRYTVTRDLDGTGADQWYAGDAVFNTGAVGDGFIDLYSLRGVKSSTQVGPTIVGNIRNSTAFNDWTERWAIGNLNGLYGYGSNTHGVAFGPYAAGTQHITIDATNGLRFFSGTSTVNAQWAANGTITVGEVAAGKSNILISSGVLNIRNNVATRIHLNTDGSGFVANSNISWDTSGNLNVAGNATIAGWTVTSTALAKDTGTNATSAGMAPADFPFFAGATVANRATAPFRVTPAGALTSTSGTVGGWTIGSTTLTSTNVALTSGAANVANIAVGTGANTGGLNAANAAGDIAFWAGSTHTNRATAPFRVEADGSLTATDATVTGTITASGTFTGSLSAATGTFTGDLTGTNMALTGKLTMSGASSAVAIGITPPTSASVGTGIWLDRTGMYGLSSDVLQAKFDAESGVISAGAGNVVLGSSGISILSSTTKSGGRDYKFTNAGQNLGGMWGLYNSGTPSFVLNIEADNTSWSSGNHIVLRAKGTSQSIALRTENASGTFQEVLTLNSGGGVTIGIAPTGGAKGTGTLNLAGDIYKNNTAYTNPDFVFERWATGRVVKFADREGARAYVGLMPLETLRSYVTTNYHLPRFGQNAGHGLFSGSDALLATVEELHLYIFQLQDRINKLEAAQRR